MEKKELKKNTKKKKIDERKEKKIDERKEKKTSVRGKITRIIIAIILVVIISVYIDFGIVKIFNRIPIFSIYKNNTYNTLFYKVWDCDGDTHVGFYDSKYSCPERVKLYKIIDESSSCDDALEPFYEDEYYIYYLSCTKSDKVFVRLTNGERITMKEALNDGKITIEEILMKDYFLYKEAKFDLKFENDETTIAKSLISHDEGYLSYDLYTKGIKEVNVIYENREYPLKEALVNNVIDINLIISNLEYEYMTGNITKGVITNIVEGEIFTVYYKDGYQYIYGKDQNNMDRYYIVNDNV